MAVMAEAPAGAPAVVAAGREMEIVFYDVETTVPERKGQGFEILEFGAVVVSAKGLEEVDSFSTLVRPSSLKLVTARSVACNGVVRESLEPAPAFQDVADRVYTLLNGRVWAGHNIVCFDNVRIKEAFAAISRPPPQAAGFIDTLPLLRRKFGTRAGNLKMASLASYFGLGKQEHRSLADVRMNIEVLKLCATVMFLESNFPEIYLVEHNGHALDVQDRRRYGTDAVEEEAQARLLVAAEQAYQQNLPEVSPANDAIHCALLEAMGENNGLQGLKHTSNGNGHAKPTRNTFDFSSLAVALEEASCEPNAEEEEPKQENSDNRFLHPKDISLHLLEAKPEGQLFILMHDSQQLCIRESEAKVKFSVSDKFAFSKSGKPTFSIVIIPSAQTNAIIKECEAAVKQKYMAMGVEAVWRPVLVTIGGEEALRIKIGTTDEATCAKYTTRIYRKSSSSASQEEVIPGDVDPKAFQQLVPRGCVVDVALSCDAYAFPGSNAGLRLLADHLILRSATL